VILLGVILLLLGLVLGIGILYTIGIVLIVIGAVLWVARRPQERDDQRRRAVLCPMRTSA
jgi:uncharacterized iron-regulated membrane protein